MIAAAATGPLPRLVVPLLLVSCAGAPPTPAEARAQQRATAAWMVEEIASNPGPLEAVCVSRRESGGNEVEFEADAGTWPETGLAVRPSDGCHEVEGRLVERESGAQAISVFVDRPEVVGRGRVEVDVLTSTGSGDVAAYRCDLREDESTWTVHRCELEAIS